VRVLFVAVAVAAVAWLIAGRAGRVLKSGEERHQCEPSSPVRS
jgi:hypothetical protein